MLQWPKQYLNRLKVLTLQFGSSGIRGKYAEIIKPETAFELARILTTSLGRDLALGRDPRVSGVVLKAAFLAAALQCGAEVKDYDLVPTPALAYQTGHIRESGGVMITASHNPTEYNGFKIFNSKGESLDDPSVLEATLDSGNVERSSQSFGRVEASQPWEYAKLLSGIRLEKESRVVLDPGNGATCQLAPQLYRQAVGKATTINSLPDGSFSGRGSEPTRERAQMLARLVREIGADAGIAFDGDGDRVYIVDEKGNRPLQDRVLATYLTFLARESKGPFLVPVDASMAVDEAVQEYGAKLLRGPVGDAKLLAEMKTEGAIFAGEPSGAWIHGGYHPCPDGILSGLLFLKQLEQLRLTVSKALEPIPEYHMVRKSISLSKEGSELDTKSLSRELEKIIGKDSATDIRFGVRVSTEDAWVLVRESGTEPVIRVTTESKRPAVSDRIAQDAVALVAKLAKGRE